MSFRARRPAAAWFAAWLTAASAAPAFAQTRVAAAPAEGFSAPASAAVAAPVPGLGSATTLSAPLSAGPGLNAAPAAFVFTAPAAQAAAASAAADGVPAADVPALAPAAGLAAPPAAAAEPAESAGLSLARESRALATPVRAGLPSAASDAAPGSSREAAAVETIENGAASWGSREAPALAVGFARGAASDDSRPLISAEWPDEPAAAPVPDLPQPAGSRARPRSARAAFYAGAVLVAAAAAAFAFPALVPASYAAARGVAVYAGFSLLSLSRYWRAPGTASPRGPPSQTGFAGLASRAWAGIDGLDRRFAQWEGRHGTLSWGTRLLRAPAAVVAWPATTMVSLTRSALATWETARVAADSQNKLEALVGGSSIDAFRDWFIGGLRSAAVWVPLALGGMLSGWALAKPFAHLVQPGDMVGMLSLDDLMKHGLFGHLFGYVASSFAAQAVSLGVFDAVRALAGKLGARRAAPWLGGAAALAVSAGLILTVTTTPSVIGSMLGIEAAVLWLRARSKSWLAPLALRGFFSLLILEAARLGLGLTAGGAAGVLAGLPSWAWIAVSGMLLAALAGAARSVRPSALWAALKAQLARVGEFGRMWHAPRHDGAPHSPWPLFKLAALCGAVLFAAGDLVYAAVHLFAGGVEPTPPVLAQMLTSPTDLVLYNFLLVGFLEEFVFRRGLFKSIYAHFKKWGLTKGRLFWTAAIVSGLIFSGAHYIDFGAVLAHLHMADATAASGLGGMYAFTLAGFASRAALGVALAWLYAESGTLFLPILAHFAADSLEGLGLHFGFVPFLAMIAGVLALQRFWKKPPPPASAAKP